MPDLKLDVKKSLCLTGLLWAIFVLVVMATRPPLPASETRALTVAWEMLARKDWLYMTLNFAPYSHKPPLIPWLVNLMWLLFGVSKAAATLVPAAVTFCVAWLTSVLAKQLWPKQDTLVSNSVWLFFGMPLVLVYGTLILYDFLLGVCVLLALISLLRALDKKKGAWWLFGLALGLGGLAKGPVILVHVLPVALLAPYWASKQKWPRYYGKLFLNVLLGIALAMCWAVPAAIHGGPDYARMIFWGQSAGRISNAFDHAEPFWFYLLLAPVYMLPWIFVVPWWRNWRKAKAFKKTTWQTRFLLCWSLPVFLVFSIISGKQIHYLFPAYPALVLGLAYLIHKNPLKARPARVPLVIYYLLGLALMLIGGIATKTMEAPLSWFTGLPVGFGLVLVIASAFLMVWSGRDIQKIVMSTTIAGFILFSIVHLAGVNHGFRAFDLGKYAKLVAAEEREKNPEPIAYVGTYEGEFGFLARLTKPVDVIPRNDIPLWHKKHPDGELIACLKPRDRQALLKGWHAEHEEVYRTARFCGVYEPPGHKHHQ